MADYLIQDTTLDAIADAINAKTGGSSAMTPAQMVTAIGTISGGSNEVLLASGTYTLESDATTMSIPVSYNGTPTKFLIYAPNPIEGVGQTIAWSRIFPAALPSEINNAFAQGYYTCYPVNANGTLNAAYNAASNLVSNNLTCGRPASAFPIKANTYNWYIWGFAS